MAKKATTKISKPAAKSSPVPALEDPPAPQVKVAAVTSPAAPEPKRVFGFLTKSRCPRCGSTNTRAYSTQGRVQYRQCMVAICRRRYVEYGKRV